MSSQTEQLKQRTMTFAISALRLINKLPQTVNAQTVGCQLAKSATSIGANYRGCCNARSRAEFIAKLRVVVEESDESVYWLEVIINTHLLPHGDVVPTHSEAIELRSIFARSLGTARANLKRTKVTK